jgi:hypothetical protein
MRFRRTPLSRFACLAGITLAMIGGSGSAALAQTTNTVTAASPAGCITLAHPGQTVAVNIARTDATGIRLFHVDFTLSPELQLTGSTATSILEGSYLSSVNPSTTFFVTAHGGGSYTVDGTILGTPCGATAASGNLFNILVSGTGGSGTGTVTVDSLTLRDCSNGNITPATAGAPATVTIDNTPVTVAAISTPQGVIETHPLTITPSATLTACATGPATWSVSPALPSGASFDTGSGEITWTPACGEAGSYGPFTLTATAASGDAGSSNAFSIVVSPQSGSVTVAAIADPQSVVEMSTLTITPSDTLTACAAGPTTWSVSPALPAGATFSTSTGVIQWTPSCGEAGSYGPFTLTATAATSQFGSSNAFTIVVTHLAGTVTVAAIADPQTIAELSALTITPVPTTAPCAGSPLVWSVSPALPAGASFDTGTGVITWTPDCAAAAGGSGGTYGPFTLTASATTGEFGSSNAFSIHVTDTPGSIDAPTAVSASQVLNGNAAGEVTGIGVHFTAPAGATSYKVYRAPFGQYPEYDDAGGATPSAPGAYPPSDPWQLTAVAADGDTDVPPGRDYWYYVVYAFNACGDVSPASMVTGGTLDYHLGDVSDGVLHGSGDNLVQSADISELGLHYGITLTPASDPSSYLDVGPTSTHHVDGRPLTDNKINFEDLVMFAINYGQVSMPSLATRPRAAQAKPAVNTMDRLVIQGPSHVAPGSLVRVPMTFDGSGAIQALSVALGWDPAVVKPVGQAAGELLLQANGLALSAVPGTVDLAVLGVGQGIAGSGELASITFQVIAEGDPRFRVASVDARDTYNEPRNIDATTATPAPELPTVTMLQMAGPNPFHQTVALAISLAQAGPIELSIYSVDGRKVRTLASGSHQPGNFRFTWDGRDEDGNTMAAGVFYARFVAGTIRTTRAITYLR